MSCLLPRHIVPTSICRLAISRSTSSAATDNKASLEQLTELQKKLAVVVPRFFAQPHPLSLYSQDMTFVNNIRGLKVQGLPKYATQIALIKCYHYVKYNSARVELLNLVNNPEESYIRIRWRIVGKAGLTRMIFNFWKIKSIDEWKDGISTMYVNKDGKIYCHVCDNIDVDTDDLDNKQKNPSLKSRLVERGLV